MTDGKDSFKKVRVFYSKDFKLNEMVKALRDIMVKQLDLEQDNKDRFVSMNDSLIIVYKKSVVIYNLTPEKCAFLEQFRHKNKDLLEDY